MNTLSELYSKANELYKIGNYNEAAELYASIIEKYPDTEEASYAKINLNLVNETKVSDPITSRNYLSLTNLVVAFVAFFIWFTLFVLDENKITIILFDPKYDLFILWLATFLGFCYANRKLTPNSPMRYINIFLVSFLLTIGWIISSVFIMFIVGGGFEF